MPDALPADETLGDAAATPRSTRWTPCCRSIRRHNPAMTA
jgi:hypothetical protein